MFILIIISILYPDIVLYQFSEYLDLVVHLERSNVNSFQQSCFFPNLFSTKSKSKQTYLLFVGYLLLLKYLGL